MAIQVTRNWSSQKLSWTSPWKAYIDFDVSGTTDPAAALAAVDPTTGVHPFQANEVCDLPGASRLKCTGPEIVNAKGPAYFVVGCNFEIPKTGTFPGTPEDPLDQPAEIDWQLVEVSESVDIDLDGLPIVAKNAEPLPPGSRPITYYRLSIYKNFPWFDFSLSQTYSNRLNSAAVSVAGIPAAAEHMRCAGVIPAGRYRADAEFIPMGFHFEIVFNDDLGLYPFQHRYLNQGTYGHWSDGGTIRRAQFSDGKGELLSRPVRLNLTGLPAGPDAFAKVGPNNAAPVALASVPSSYNTETLTDGFALIYKRTKTVNMNPLLAIL